MTSNLRNPSSGTSFVVGCYSIPRLCYSSWTLLLSLVIIINNVNSQEGYPYRGRDRAEQGGGGGGGRYENPLFDTYHSSPKQQPQPQQPTSVVDVNGHRKLSKTSFMTSSCHGFGCIMRYGDPSSSSSSSSTTTNGGSSNGHDYPSDMGGGGPAGGPYYNDPFYGNYPDPYGDQSDNNNNNKNKKGGGANSRIGGGEYDGGDSSGTTSASTSSSSIRGAAAGSGSHYASLSGAGGGGGGGGGSYQKPLYGDPFRGIDPSDNYNDGSLNSNGGGGGGYDGGSDGKKDDKGFLSWLLTNKFWDNNSSSSSSSSKTQTTTCKQQIDRCKPKINSVTFVYRGFNCDTSPCTPGLDCDVFVRPDQQNCASCTDHVLDSLPLPELPYIIVSDCEGDTTTTPLYEGNIESPGLFTVVGGLVDNNNNGGTTTTTTTTLVPDMLCIKFYHQGPSRPSGLVQELKFYTSCHFEVGNTFGSISVVEYTFFDYKATCSLMK